MTSMLTPSSTVATTPADAIRPSRGRGEWAALTALLLGTAVLTLWDLSINRWANSFYSGAVQAMTRNGEAYFFGSSDAGLTVTVDKPPLSVWVMALSARIFGLSSWSVLVPQALMGVATVALLYAAVRRVTGPGAALLAGAVMALTPVAVLMFRFNNPDALLVLLTVAAAYAVVRGLEHAATRWLLLAGALLGLAFLTKTAQAFLVLPGLALAYLWAAPTGFWRRVRQLLAGGAAMVVVGGWWFVIVDLWPPGSRPYIGGSVGDSAVELAIGYNGLGRIFGGEFGATSAGAFGGGGMAGGFSPFGAAGPARLFTPDIAGQISWLLPAALILMVAGLVLTWRAPRTDPTRASLLVWGGWTLVTAGVFSFMQGIFHQYYTVALAPGIAALVGIGGALMWRRRSRVGVRLGLAGIVLLSTAAAAVIVLLAGLPTWLLALVAVAGLAGAVLLVLPGRGVAVAGLAAAIGAASLGPLAFDVATLRTAETSPIPLAGPAGGGLGGIAAMLPGLPAGTTMPAGGGGMMGGMTGDGAVDPELETLLRDAGTPWAAATLGASSASELALASGADVMGIGGFLGSDPAPTLEQFQADVTARKIHYYVDGGPFGGAGYVDPAEMIATLPPDVRDNPRFEAMIAQFETGGAAAGGPFGAGGPGSAISDWVKQHYPSQQVGSRTVYDLTTPLP